MCWWRGTGTSDQGVRDCDAHWKQANKYYVDMRLHTREKEVKQGNIVLLEKRKDNKLSTAYEKEPYTVLSRYGDQGILGSSQEVQCTRNLQHFKPFYFPDQGDQAENEDPELATSSLSSAPETEALLPGGPVQMQEQPLNCCYQATTCDPFTTTRGTCAETWTASCCKEVRKS